MSRWTSRYDRMARDNTCRDHALRGSKRWSAVQALEHAETELERYGTRTHVQAKTPARVSRMGVTVSAKLVLLPHDWNERSAYRKALLLLHELVHVRQWRKYLFFGARWSTSPRFRVAMEAQAYRESVSAMVMLGYSDDSIADYINRLSVTFHKTYHTGNVDVDIGPCLRDSVSEAQIGLRG